MPFDVKFGTSDMRLGVTFDSLQVVETGSGGGGVDGKDGKSAYEIAVLHGFKGSESEWLDSLHGEDGQPGEDGYTPIKGVDYFDGKDGEDGKSAYQYALDGGYTGTEAEFAAKMAKEIPAPYQLPIATADTLGGVMVGEGLQMDGGVLGVVPETLYVVIETITIDEAGMRRIMRQQTPQGHEYSYKRIMIEVESKATETENITFATTVIFSDGSTLYDYTTSAIRKNYASVFRCWVNMGADGSCTMYSAVGGVLEETIASSATREYRGIGTTANRVTGIDVAAMADIPVGTTIKILGVRADA